MHEVDAQHGLARKREAAALAPRQKGEAKITRSPQGRTLSISPSNSQRRIRLAVCPKPRLCCLMLRIVLVLHVNAKQVVRRFMQTFLRQFLRYD